MKVEHANVEPEYVLGLCYTDVARYDDARHAFATQYGFGGESPEAYLLAGRLFLRRELRDQAAAQANKALELNPNLPLAHELLGETALARGDLPAAIQELESERKINPLDEMCTTAWATLTCEADSSRGADGAQSRGIAGAERDRPVHSAGARPCSS